MANLFEISDIVKKHIDRHLPVKAQYTVTERETKEITMENGEFSLFRTLFDNEIDISVIKNKKTGATSINKFDEDSIKDAVESVFTSAQSASEDDAYDIAPKMEEGHFEIGALEPDIDKLMQRAEEFAADIAKKYPKVLVMQLMFKYVKEHSVYRNTNGSLDETTKGYYVVMAEFAGNDGENSTGISGAGAYINNLDVPFIEVGNIAYSLKTSEDSLNLVPVEGKFDGDVIFTPDCFAQMLMFTVDNFISDSVLIDGTSMWKDKLNKKVASDIFTLEYDPWDERIVNHEVHTVDGFRSEKVTVIKNGELKAFTPSLYGANKCNLEPAKCSEMDFVIEPGDTSLDDMIKSIDRGLIVGAISCGYPSANGEIAGVAKNAFYVENGEIKGAVMETMVSFTLPQMLENIVAISKELPVDGGAVIPFVKVKDINISGK